MSGFIITSVHDLPDGLDSLVVESLNEGFRFVERLRDEWVSGANRFSLTGEALFEVWQDRRLVGVCGLNRDPYTGDPSVGRLRRLYVSTDSRRSGVGRALVMHVIESAGRNFETLRLRSQPGAVNFFVAVGFEPVAGDPYATHSMDVLRRAV